MDYVGIDVHKKDSQICIVAEGGELIERRVRTEVGRLADMFEKRPHARILIEASTDSEWVARCLEGLGHEVVVADPNFAPMYAARRRTVKTDRRDARALANACVLGAYRPAHRLSDAQRHVRRAPGRARGAGPDPHPVYLADPGAVAARRLAGSDGERGRLRPACPGAPPAGPATVRGRAVARGDAARRSAARLCGRADCGVHRHGPPGAPAAERAERGAGDGRRLRGGAGRRAALSPGA